MKNLVIIAPLVLAACHMTVTPNQYIANMYAKGSLKGYGNSVGGESGCQQGPSCPGCHVQYFDRVKLVVEEILARPENGHKKVDACEVTVTDSLGLMNISETRYIPATDAYDCEIVYDKEKAYLKAMGFEE